MNDGQKVPFQGSVRLRLAGDGRAEELSGLQIEVSDDALTATGRGAAPLRLEYAEVAAATPGDYVLALELADGTRADFAMLGRRFGEFADALTCALHAYRARHLLLEEPVGGESFACDVESGGAGARPAEVRVYATSLAMLPRAEVPFALPFGEVTSLEFSEKDYAVVLSTADGPVRLLRCGRQTRPLAALLEARLAALRERTSAALAALLPPLPTMQLRRAAQLLPDGVPARKAQLDAVAPTLWPALRDAAINAALRPAFDRLMALSLADEAAFGLKETNARQDAGRDDGDGAEPEGSADEAAGGAEGDAADADDRMRGRTAWYAFPIAAAAGHAIAVEAVTRSGRATYLFRLAPDPALKAGGEELLRHARERIRTISRALVALGFRREPIYLSDAQLATPRHAGYRLALRASRPLTLAREAFLGRAIHGAGWERQLEAALARSRG